MDTTYSRTAAPAATVSREEVAEILGAACPAKEYRDKKILVIVPDATRTAPVGLLFQILFEQIGGVTRNLDILVALGTHQPLSEAAICERLEMSETERSGKYRSVRFFNHAWNDPSALKRVGVIPSAEISRLSEGLFGMDVPVDVNKLVFDYDQIVIIGPVFPHEVVGFSGGNKYLFPGRGRPGDPEFFPLAGRGRDEPDDHWEQVDAGAAGGGSGGSDGDGAEALFLHGGGRKESGGFVRGITRGGVGQCERIVASTAHHLQRKTVSYDLVLRAEDVR